MRRLVAAGVGAVATLGTIGVAAPAQAATTGAKDFELIYGASYYTGSVSFSNRTVTATGLLHSVAGSGCRWVSVKAWVGATEFPAVVGPVGKCYGEADDVSWGITVDVPGGPTKVVVGLWTSSDRTKNDLTLVRTSKPILR